MVKSVLVIYHGTSHALATAMATNPGTIDVTKGRGEFGRGFYTQTSRANAYRRGFIVYGNNRAVLQLEIEDRAYHALSIKYLTLNAAQHLNATLRANKTQGTYITAHDVIEGPLVGQAKITQHKFQSTVAQNLVNGPQTTRTVLP